MTWEPELAPAPTRSARIGQWVGFAFAGLLIALLAYLGYLGFVGSGQLTAAPDPSRACGTPKDVGLEYEALNYPVDSDATLAAYPDHDACPAQGTAAGSALVAVDGTRIAGWYIPSTGEIGPEGATVVLVHGWGGDKSELLGLAAMLAPTYNVVAFDLRHHGQSASDRPTTQGVAEQRDLVAILDWLSSTKQPARIAVLGVSMGGVVAANVAARDSRVAAVILDSTPATLQSAVQSQLEASGYPLALPGSWAILLGGLLRTGIDMTSADADAAVRRLEIPLLLIAGDADPMGGIAAEGVLKSSAAAHDVDVTAEQCGGGTHARLLDACADAYRGWVLGFLDRAL